MVSPQLGGHTLSGVCSLTSALLNCSIIDLSFDVIGQLCDTVEVDQGGGGHEHVEQLVTVPPDITFAGEVTFGYSEGVKHCSK